MTKSNYFDKKFGLRTVRVNQIILTTLCEPCVYVPGIVNIPQDAVSYIVLLFQIRKLRHRIKYLSPGSSHSKNQIQFWTTKSASDYLGLKLGMCVLPD